MTLHFYKCINASLALIVRISVPELIFFVMFDRFTYLSSIILPSLFLSGLIQLDLAKAEEVVFSIGMSKAIILLKSIEALAKF